MFSKLTSPYKNDQDSCAVPRTADQLTAIAVNYGQSVLGAWEKDPVLLSVGWLIGN